MNARKKALELLKTARSERAEAVSRNDTAAADKLLQTVINPLKQQIASGTLDALGGQAQALNALSDLLESALVDLRRSVDRFFFDDLVRKARELKLLAEAETDEAHATAPSTPPAADESAAETATASGTDAGAVAGDAEPVARDAVPPPRSAQEYKNAYERLTIRDDWSARVASATEIFLRDGAKRRYDAVAAETGVPWWVVGLLHLMEASQNFSRHLHNGDPLSARTVNVPAGRPLDWHPGMTWEESAADALVNVKHLDQVEDWSIGAFLERAEGWNGFGYRNRGIWTPFLWSGTTYYERGKFTRDGVFDPDFVSKQVGIAPMIAQLVNVGFLSLPARGDVNVRPASALTAPRALPVDLGRFPHAEDELAFSMATGKTVEPGMGRGRRASAGNKMKVRRVQEWCVLHGFVTACDGEYGDATAGVVRAFRRAHNLPGADTVDEECWALLTTPMRRALASAAEPSAIVRTSLEEAVLDVGAAHIAESPCEAGGNNRGPWVRLYMEGGESAPNRDDFAWCAGFACFLVQQAARELGADMPIRRRTLVAHLVADAKSDGRFVDGDAIGQGADRAVRVPVGGFFVRRGGPNGWDHTGIVTAVDEETFTTIEGNTTGGPTGGGRDGGIAKRSTRSFGKYDFVRLT
jgi:lysozyme family protein